MTAGAWRVERDPSSDGYALWAEGDPAEAWWTGGLHRSQALAIAQQHNATLGLDRPTVGDLEAFAIRVLAGAIRELLRGLLPRRLRHRRRLSTHGDKPVYERAGR